MARYLQTLTTTLFIFFIPVSPIAAEVIQIDSDFNGKFDQWHHKSKEGKIIKIQFDKNEDGKVDQVDKYNSNEKPFQVELDKNYDGNLDQIQHYNEKFILTHIEKDSNNSGQIDWREFYSRNGIIARIESDENKDGKFDVYQYFSSKGVVLITSPIAPSFINSMLVAPIDILSGSMTTCSLVNPESLYTSLSNDSLESKLMIEDEDLS